MKQVNLRLFIVLVGMAVVGIAGTYFLHRFQVARNAGGIVKLARAKLDEGKSDEAIALYGRYLGYRRDDAQALAEYAKLLLDRVNRPGVNRDAITLAFQTLEEAVRKKPDDHDLRRKLADFQLRIGRHADARAHLLMLRDLCTEDSKPPLDKAGIDLALARSWGGSGNFDEAAGIAADMIGFDLQRRSFQDKSASQDERDGDREKHGKEQGKENDAGQPAKAAAPTEAYVLLAAIFDEKKGDRDSTKRILDRLLEDNPADYSAWLSYARWCRQRGDLAAAASAVKKAAALAPDDPETMIASFEIFLAERKLDEAAGVVRTAMEKHASDDRMIRAAAILAIQQAAPARAIEILQDGIKKAGPQPVISLMLADLLLQQNRLAEVEKALDSLKESLGASNPAVGMLEARLLIARQQWLPAKQKLERVRPLVVASSDLTSQVDLLLGQCHEQLGQYDEQLEVNRRVLGDDPTSLAARVGAANALAASGKPEQALAEFELVAGSIAPEKLPAIPQVWSPLLQLRINVQSRKPAAERDWSRVDELIEMLGSSEQISDEQIAIIRAELLVRKDEPKEAFDLLEKALKANPNSPPLLSSLTTFVLRQNGPEAAQAIIDKTPPSVRDTPAFMLVEAQVVSRPGRRVPDAGKADGDAGAAAVERLKEIEKRAMKLESKDEAARVISGLASLCFGLRHRGEAERLWAKAVELRPDNLGLRMVLLDMAREEADAGKVKAVATEIAKLAGPTTAIGRFAEATSRIVDTRKSLLQKAARSNEVVGEMGKAERANLREARNLLIEAENERPGWAAVQQLFAEVDGLEGDIPSSIERLQNAVRLGSGNPEVVRQLVTLLYASNRFNEAQQVLGTIGPDGLGGFERISAELKLRGGDVEEAVAIAERTVKDDSTNASELLWLGQLLSRSGKSARGEEVLSRAVEVAKDRPEAWLSLIGHQISTGRRSIAERTLDRAGESLAGLERQLVLSQGSEMLGRPDDAERYLKEAVAERKDDLNTLRAFAAFLVRRGKVVEGRELLSKIVESPDRSASDRGIKVWARRTLAELIAERGSYAMLQKAIAMLQQNTDANGELGPEDHAIAIRLLADRQEPSSWRRAIELLSALRKLQPLSIGQRLMVAQLREKLGFWEDCRSELLSLVAMPDSPPAIHAMLVERLIEHDETSSARTWLQRLRQKAGEAPVTIALEAKLAMAEKDRPKAVAAARKLMPSGPVAAEQLPQLGSTAKLMEDLGFPKAADKLLTEFAERSPDGIVARAEFLGRQKRPEEGLQLLEAAWDRLPLEQLLRTTVLVARVQGTSLEPAVRSRIDKLFARARRQDPGSLVLGLLEAEMREIQGQSDEVESMYRKLLAQSGLEKTQRAIVANNLAFHLARKETAKEALGLIESAIQELGPHPDLLDTRGVVQTELGNYSNAVEDLREASLVPTPVKLLHLAVAQEGAAQIEGARRSLARARKLGLIAEQLNKADRVRLERLDAALGTEESQPVSIRDRARASSASWIRPARMHATESAV